jgi:hypothetical protein
MTLAEVCSSVRNWHRHSIALLTSVLRPRSMRTILIHSWVQSCVVRKAPTMCRSAALMGWAWFTDKAIFQCAIYCTRLGPSNWEFGGIWGGGLVTVRHYCFPSHSPARFHPYRTGPFVRFLGETARRPRSRSLPRISPSGDYVNQLLG